MFMQVRKITKICLCLIITGLTTLLLIGTTVNAQFSGTTYKFEEAQVGTGSDNDLQTGTYSGRATAGDTGVGIVKGTTYQGVGGFTTTSDPVLEVNVAPLTLDLGNASTGSALTGSTKFGVRTYLASGYTVFIQGLAPTQESGYSMSTLSSQTASSPGTEQFGVYLSANNAPSSSAVCADLPDTSFSFGTVVTGYQTVGQYKYINGDSVAQSTSSSGCTEYTVNYLVNISTITRAGTYSFNQTVGVVSTF